MVDTRWSLSAEASLIESYVIDRMALRIIEWQFLQEGTPQPNFVFVELPNKDRV